MLPVIVLCRVYTTYLNTTPDAHMHRMQRPLPQEELYNPDAPSAGLMALLKFALWQVLWVESASSKLLDWLPLSCSCTHLQVARHATVSHRQVGITCSCRLHADTCFLEHAWPDIDNVQPGC